MVREAAAPVRYVTAPATIGPIARSVTATGTVNPELTIIVGTYVSGVIQELTCDYNTQVKRGQTCAKIDPRPYQSIVDQTRANLAVANAQLEKDKASLDLCEGRTSNAPRFSSGQRPCPKDAFDNAQSVYDQALAQITFDEATIQQRQAMLDAAQVNLDYTNIKSPVDGTVVSRNVTMGQTVAASFQTPTLVPDRDRPHQDASRCQCERKRHRWHQKGQQGDIHRRCVFKALVRGDCDSGPPIPADGAKCRDL